MSANETRFPVLWMFFLLKRKLPQRTGNHCLQVAPPWPLAACSQRAHTQAHTHIGPQFLSMPRGTAQSIKDTGRGRRNLPALENTVEMEWVDPGSSCSRGHLRNEPASALSILHTIPRGHGETAAHPLLSSSGSFLQRGDRHNGLPKAPSPSPSPPHPGRELAVGSSPLPGSSPPAPLWPEQG